MFLRSLGQFNASLLTVIQNTSVSRLDVSEEMEMQNPDWLQNTSSERENIWIDLHILVHTADIRCIKHQCSCTSYWQFNLISHLFDNLSSLNSVRRTLLHSLSFRLLVTGPLSAQVMVSITARPTPSLWTTSTRTASATTMTGVTPSKTDSPSLSGIVPTCSSSSKRVKKRSVNFLCYLSFSLCPIVISVIVIAVCREHFWKCPPNIVKYS